MVAGGHYDLDVIRYVLQEVVEHLVLLVYVADDKLLLLVRVHADAVRYVPGDAYVFYLPCQLARLPPPVQPVSEGREVLVQEVPASEVEV